MLLRDEYMMKKSGFTLTELLITIAILAMTLAIGVPSFNDFLSNSSMASSSNNMISAFNYARLEAMKRGNPVEVGQVDTNIGWTSGVVVWVDNSGDDIRDSGEELRIWSAFSNGSTVTTNNGVNAFTFSGTGEVDSSDTFTLCDDRTQEEGMAILILISGAVIPQRITCG